MTAVAPEFALNHMCAPGLSVSEFFDLARALGVSGVEIRNDLAGNAIADGTPPAASARAAGERGLRILSINALQRFNDWNAAREEEARALIAYARDCGAEALVLVPTNDGSGRANGERQANLRIALKGLRPILEQAGILGLVEPLGFETCSLRLKSEAVEAIEALDMKGTFRVVHDTFHHCLAGEASLYPQHTGLVHISGVTEAAMGIAEMRDAHRVLVDEQDRLDNIGQIAALLEAGYCGPLSFEPFSETVHRLPDIGSALARSMAYITERSRRHAA
ncbi:TIM barrel protein [Chelativorans sp. AA-79]|uniref:TIM barrel protein n=1 Tax=Chelativorans sp. AA-79 TaxID=3028735 RepID=UPI0023F7BA6D|nr:TIM barrel protein [Chelativorans sp. AA-79]WEX08394.1 TIM barrel protein [Chelativorans sp. AA-79]